MLGDARRRTGHHVRGRAEFQWDTPIADVGGQRAQPVGAVGASLDVVDDAHPMAESVGAAPLDRLPDAGKPEGLARVDREVRVLSAEVLERIEVPGGREAGLATSDVEADHITIAVLDDEVGDLAAVGSGAHRGEKGADPDAGSSLTLAEAIEDGVDDVAQR